MTPGTIIFDSAFEFKDGQIGQKLMVILNDGTAGKYISVNTTSQPRLKHRKAGCQSGDYYPNFYLPDSSCCLRGESWVLLNSFYPFDLQHFQTHIASGRMRVIGCLPLNILKDLLDCAIDCKDITREEEQILIDVRNIL